jgi:hypothetical protein
LACWRFGLLLLICYRLWSCLLVNNLRLYFFLNPFLVVSPFWNIIQCRELVRAELAIVVKAKGRSDMMKC